MRKKPLKSRFEILQQKKITPLDTPTDESLLTREEAAAYCRCSVRTLIRRIEEGKIREVKHGNISRIKKAELDRLLGENDKPKRTVAGLTADYEEAICRAAEFDAGFDTVVCFAPPLR